MAVLIRLAGADDAAAICGIYEPYVSGTRITFEEVPPTSEDVCQRMSSPIHPWLVLEEDGEVVGYTSTSALRARAAYRWSVETGIYLAPSVQGRGWGRLLLGEHLGLLERQGFVSALAGVALPNEASVAVHKSLGFELSGVERGPGFKLGAWADVARFQKDLAPRQSSPSDPLPAAGVWA